MDCTVIKLLEANLIREEALQSKRVHQFIRTQADSQSDIPVLNNNLSWQELWNEVLSTDFAGVDFPAQFDSLEVNNPTVFDPGDGIESWATQNILPFSGDLTPEPTLTSQSGFTPGQALTPPPKQVCYGMVSSLRKHCYSRSLYSNANLFTDIIQIHRAAVKVQGDMMEVEARLKAGNGSVEEGYNSFNLNLLDERLILEFQDGSTFGILNAHVTNALKDILNMPTVEFDAMGHTVQIRETIERARSAKDAMVRVHINIYGPKDTAEEIGRHLSLHKNYLQRPDVSRRAIVYDNPHVFKFSGIQLPDSENRVEVGKQRLSANDENKQFQKTINDVYASLTRGNHLNQVQGDDRLRTTLLP